MFDHPLLSLVWVVLCVVGILCLAYWATRFVGTRGFGGAWGGQNGEQCKVLTRLGLGKDQALALVKMGERYFLLGVASSGVTVLAELTREEAEACLTREEDKPTPPSFGEALRTVIGRKRQR